jgi:hypothetical protein
MMGFIRSLLGFLSGLFKFLGDRQLIQAGEEKAEGKITKEVLVDVEKAKSVERVADPGRDERLRGKYDRSKRK